MIYGIRRWSKAFDRKYAPLIPPFDKAPVLFSEEETDAYFHWYMEHIDERCEYLRKLVAEDAGISVEKLDDSLDSLLPLWRWFLRRARVVRKKLPRPYERVSVISRETEGKAVKKVLKYEEYFDVKTEMMIRDIGMYVGRMFIRSFPGKVRWNVVRKPKNYIHVNEPLLQGFVRPRSLADGRELTPPFHPDFEPIHMVGVQAAALFDKKAKADDLYKICRKWADWIPV